MKVFLTPLLLIISISILLTTTVSSAREDSLRLTYGIFTHYGQNIHTADFKTIPDCPGCSPGYESGNGPGLALGLLVDFPLGQKLFLSARAGYYNLYATISRNESTKVLIDDKLTDGQFKHTIEAGLSTIGIEPSINYYVIDKLSLTLGLNAGVYITKKYNQKEEIINPSGQGVFSDTKTRTRNNFSGDLKYIAGLSLSAIIGAGYELPLNTYGTLFLVPEVYYSIGLTNIVTGINWKSNAFRGGLALKYSPKPVIPKIEEFLKKINFDTIQIVKKTEKQYLSPGKPIFQEKFKEENEKVISFTDIYKQTDTLYIPKQSNLKAVISAIAVYPDGSRKKATKIEIKQRYVTQAFPILPCIFFNKNESKIPQTYSIISSSGDFAINNLETNPIVFHKNLLNIIGERLKKNTKSTIKLQGYTDATSEFGDCKLALDRAQEVRNYLTSIWGIEDKRIIINKQLRNCSPFNETQTQNEEGWSENRRVEFESDDQTLLAPIAKRRYLETPEITPPELQYEPNGSTTSGVSEWSISSRQEGKMIHTETGSGSPKATSRTITESHANQLVSGKDLTVEFRIKNYENEEAIAKDILSVRKDTSDTEIERLSLALFQVSGDDLRPIDKKAIGEFIKDLSSDDTITVTGYTDMLGNPDENILLSERRAKSVCNYLTQLISTRKISPVMKSCQGIAFQRKPPQIYSYDTPEERFLSRTVQIEISRRWR